MENGLLAKEFVTFCVSGCADPADWECLYDCMCWVAGRRLYRGMGYKELSDAGVGLGLLDLDNTYALVSKSISIS